MQAQHRPYLLSLQKSFTASLKNDSQYIKNICKSIIDNKNNQQYMFVTLVSCHFVTLISIKSAPVLSTSGDNFLEENRKKIGQSHFC